uniref:F-box domain-containing protein n=1 Tax=Triticum urartu TaxID=4572 RepID=A0A8R7QGM0_TRIUA
MAGDSNDAIPRDVLASVLLRFPASDLRHFRHVCKEWCEVISDPAFIDAHMIHGPQPLTHTIVFFLGRKGGEADEAIEPRSGDGYLFDEHWRFLARFTAGESENMVGTCNGLLCFLDFHQADIRVVEPFTGESLVLPPPETQRRCEPTAYCFGFDPSSRRYKILHQGCDLHKGDATVKDLYVYTIGGGGIGVVRWHGSASASEGRPLRSGDGGGAPTRVQLRPR